ncbi:RsfA family transcriptional regulator [Bacillus sp. T33-2]|uniref:RsfA family transcriptional regulator n=1 Tax=Bacillus sp. T33-2 TaxID=2054168 RepID=UPI000C759A0C|nr:RsfA family transcriptional regulator [Bacillus sp. T33-2]PLR97394.1 RsfA family transcriptional regulator [Bacillus sp. T33-2]
MPLTRQDAWNLDEDLLLAEVVLRHIREGGTQLKAFEEVGKKLSRTAAACGFRWNSFVRKQYKSGIELAKKQRKESKKQPKVQEKEHLQEETVPKTEPAGGQEASPAPPVLNLSDVKLFLDQLHEKAQKTNGQEKSLEEHEGRIKELERQIYYLSAENEKLEKELKTIEADYRALIEIMERARKMVVLKEEDNQHKVKFQMAQNGNLEKIEK